MSSTPTEPRDKLGRVITEGSFIVYGHAIGRSAGLRIGRVLELVWKPAQYYRAPSWNIRVQGVDDDWGSKVEPKLCKPGTLWFPERTIVIDAGQLSDAVRALIGPIGKV